MSINLDFSLLPKFDLAMSLLNMPTGLTPKTPEVASPWTPTPQAPKMSKKKVRAFKFSRDDIKASKAGQLVKCLPRNKV